MQLARTSRTHHSRCAFTLIELILVMTILLVVLSLSAPTLKNFFRGRTLDVEARRLLALTHYGQNRAVSEGVPMVLWIDPDQGRYGLEMQSGFSTEENDRDDKSVELKLDSKLKIEVTAGQTPLNSSANRTAMPGASVSVSKSAQSIRFTPDGFIGSSNPQQIIIREGDQDAVRLAPNKLRSNYEIKTNAQEIAEL
jgi:prepilin-type N-terminal cleavage/methylation domain-containing protein